jgi:hypothetical protein
MSYCLEGFKPTVYYIMTASFFLQRQFAFFLDGQFSLSLNLFSFSIPFVSIKQNLSILSFFSHIISVSLRLDTILDLSIILFLLYIWLCFLFYRCLYYPIFFADKNRGNLIR